MNYITRNRIIAVMLAVCECIVLGYCLGLFIEPAFTLSNLAVSIVMIVSLSLYFSLLVNFILS